ncbi:hypothetical protein RI367_004105 [Sorochytrium milnesiophthora]
MILFPRIKEDARFPATVTTTTGKPLSLADDVFSHYDTLYVITLKFVFCPICSNLLKIINFMLGFNAKDNKRGFPREWRDPMSTGYAVRLASQGDMRIYQHNFSSVFFLVLCPGPTDNVIDLERDTGFPYPWIPDPDMELCGQLGIKMPPIGCWPAILEVKRDGRMETVRIGRGPGYLFYAAAWCKLKHTQSKAASARFYGDLDLVQYMYKQRIAADVRALSGVLRMRRTTDWLQNLLDAARQQALSSPSTADLGLPNELALQILEQLDAIELRPALLASRRLRVLALDTLLIRARRLLARIQDIAVAHAAIPTDELLKWLKTRKLYPSKSGLVSSGAGVSTTLNVCNDVDAFAASVGC